MVASSNTSELGQFLRNTLSGVQENASIATNALVVPLGRRTTLSRARDQINSSFDNFEKKLKKIIDSDDDNNDYIKDFIKDYKLDKEGVSLPGKGKNKKGLSGGSGNLLGTVLGGLLGLAAVFAVDVIKELTKISNNMVKSVKQWFSDKYTEMVGWLKKQMGYIENFVTNLGKEAKDAITGAYTAITDTLEKGFGYIVGTVHNWAVSSEKVIDNIFSIVPDYLFARDPQIPLGVLSKAEATVSKFFNNMIESLKKWLYSIFDFGSNIVGNVVGSKGLGGEIANIQNASLGGGDGYKSGGGSDTTGGNEGRPWNEKGAPPTLRSHGKQLDQPSFTGGKEGVLPSPNLQHLPANLRNNNPGNITDGKFAASQPGYKGTNGRFATFDTMESGYRAANKLLDIYAKQGLDTPAKILQKWAPSGDGANDPAAYATKVQKLTGLDANKPLGNDSLSRAKFLRGMTQVEGGKSPYTPEQISSAIGNRSYNQPPMTPATAASATVTPNKSGIAELPSSLPNNGIGNIGSGTPTATPQVDNKSSTAVPIPIPKVDPNKSSVTEDSDISPKSGVGHIGSSEDMNKVVPMTPLAPTSAPANDNSEGKTSSNTTSVKDSYISPSVADGHEESRPVSNLGQLALGSRKADG
jgi:gas vesicle protein